MNNVVSGECIYIKRKGITTLLLGIVFGVLNYFSIDVVITATRLIIMTSTRKYSKCKVFTPIAQNGLQSLKRLTLHSPLPSSAGKRITQ